MDSLVGRQWKVHPVIKYGFFLVLFAALGFLTVIKGPLVLGAVLGLGIFCWVITLLFKYPKLHIYAVMLLAFSMSTLSRYLPVSVPYSLVIDSLLIGFFLVLVIKHWEYTDWSLANRSLFWALAIWMGYIILQLFNPEAPSKTAWFYVMRAIAMYPLLLAAIGLIIFNNKKDFYRFLNLWLIISALGILWGLKQDIFGVTLAEKRWLDAGAAGTHILWGKLRVFSFYPDAAVFGPAMGQVCIAALILFLGPYSKKRKWIYLALGIFSFYALVLSGTRGALAVPAIGGIAYLVMIRKIKLLLIGCGVLLAGFVFLKYTSIGDSNYDINRMRTALNPEDASLNTRMRNRAMLTEYLKDKPFGGGVGTAGFWGRRFSPNTWLANFEPDGLYTQIRAETGIVGRNLFVGILLFILGRAIFIIWKLKNSEYQNLAMAIVAGYAGLLMANYGNAVMTPFPNNIITFLGLAFVFSMRYWNEEGEVELPDRPTPVAGARPKTSSWDN